MSLRKFFVNFVLIIVYEIGLVGLIVVVSNYMAGHGTLAEAPAGIRAIPFVVGLFLFALPIVGVAVWPHLNWTPRWMVALAQSGQVAPAVVVANEVLKGVGGYEGADLWVTLPVRVTPAGANPFPTQLHCRLSRSFRLQAGQTITIRYDPNQPKRVIEQP